MVAILWCLTSVPTSKENVLLTSLTFVSSEILYVSLNLGVCNLHDLSSTVFLHLFCNFNMLKKLFAWQVIYLLLMRPICHTSETLNFLLVSSKSVCAYKTDEY